MEAWTYPQPPLPVFTTTTLDPTAGHAFKGPGADVAAAPGLYANLALVANSKADAEILQWPKALGGLLAALHTALGLGFDDQVEVQEVKVVAFGTRRLASNSSASLAGAAWEARLRIFVKALGRVHFEAVRLALELLGSVDSVELRRAFNRDLNDELASRGLTDNEVDEGGIALLRVVVWQDNEPNVPLVSAADPGVPANRADGGSNAERGDAAQSERIRAHNETDLLPLEWILFAAGVGLILCLCGLLGAVYVFGPRRRAMPVEYKNHTGKRTAVHNLGKEEVSTKLPATGPGSWKPPPRKFAWDLDSGGHCATPASTACSTSSIGLGAASRPSSGSSATDTSLSQLRALACLDSRAEGCEIVAQPCAPDDLDLHSCATPDPVDRQGALSSQAAEARRSTVH